MSDLAERRREQEPNHLRHVDVQALDALLRIEELLTTQIEGLRVIAQRLSAQKQPSVEELQQTKTVKKR